MHARIVKSNRQTDRDGKADLPATEITNPAPKCSPISSMNTEKRRNTYAHIQVQTGIDM